MSLDPMDQQQQAALRLARQGPRLHELGLANEGQLVVEGLQVAQPLLVDLALHEAVDEGPRDRYVVYERRQPPLPVKLKDTCI